MADSKKTPPGFQTFATLLKSEKAASCLIQKLTDMDKGGTAPSNIYFKSRAAFAVASQENGIPTVEMQYKISGGTQRYKFFKEALVYLKKHYRQVTISAFTSGLFYEREFSDDDPEVCMPPPPAQPAFDNPPDNTDAGENFFNLLEEFLQELGFRGGNPELLFYCKSGPGGLAFVDFDQDSEVLVSFSSFDTPETRAHMEFFSNLADESRRLVMDQRKKANKFYIFSSSPQGISIDSIDIPIFEFIPGNYSEEVRDSYKYIIEELQKKIPNGRIALFSGPPGTGKTFMVRSFITEARKCAVILVPNTMISGLESPQLLTTLIEFRESELLSDQKMIFVIEDADAALGSRKRGQGDLLSVTSILNLTDGIVGDSLGIRVIATTNLENVHLDEAIMRPGRLLKHVQIGKLSPAEASATYKRLSGKEKEYKEPATLASVYADAKDYSRHFPSKEKKALKKRIGFGAN